MLYYVSWQSFTVVSVYGPVCQQAVDFNNGAFLKERDLSMRRKWTLFLIVSNVERSVAH